jgi:hypothetical protein
MARENLVLSLNPDGAAGDFVARIAGMNAKRPQPFWNTHILQT